MDFVITNVPFWASLIFLISFTAPIFMIAHVVKKGLLTGGKGETYARRIQRNIIVFYFAFYVIVSILSLFGVFYVNLIPPRIIVLAAIPLFLFYVLFVRRTEWFKVAFEHLKLESIVWIHLFRFVGIFFFINYYYETLPWGFALKGGAGDIISAILAIAVVYALQTKMSFAKPFAWVWNFIGLADILIVVSTAIIISKEAIAAGTPGVVELAAFPFSLIPAFAPSTIIFLHLLVFEKLLKSEKGKG